MMAVLWTVLEVLVNLFQGSMFLYFAFCVLPYRHSKIKRWMIFCGGSVLLGAVITLFNHLTYFEGAAAFIYSGILLLICLLFFEGSFFKKLLVSVIPMSCVAISASAGIQFTALLFQKSFVELITEQNLFRFFYIFLANTILFVILYFLQRLFNRNKVSLKRSEWILAGSVFSLSILILMFFYLMVFAGISELGKIYMALALIVVIAINLTVYFLLVQLSKKHDIAMENSLLKQQYEFQAESIRKVKEQYEELQKTRHDFNNTLRVVQSLNKEKKSEQIDTYILRYLSEQKQSVKFVTTSNDYVNAILNSKLSKASDNNIHVLLNISKDLPLFPSIDLCNLLGNLWDNALEACEKCDGEREIQFDLLCEKEGLDIFLRKTVPAPVLSQNPDLKTDKKDSRSHGYGTKIISEIAEKYHGYADFYEEDGRFCCHVFLAAPEPCTHTDSSVCR